MRKSDAIRLLPLVLLALGIWFGVVVPADDVLVNAGSHEPSASEPLSLSDEYSVVRVVDGDTLRVLTPQGEVSVRVIGINAPESVDPRRPVQCFGKEASTHFAQLVGSDSVTLTRDPSQGDVDKYGRWLRYVFVGGGDVGEKMLEDGYAFEYTYDVPYARQAEYQAAEESARSAGSGLWALETCNGSV